MKNKDDLKLIVFKSARELGESLNLHLKERYGIQDKNYSFILPISELFFEDGHHKTEINESVRGKKIFYLTDIGNYSLEYKMHGFINHTSPNDLYIQLKDGIGACNCHAKEINVIMPLLWNSRQHRRNTRENLACGMMLRELDNIKGINSLITFDVHDQGVEHATSKLEFDNFYATNVILEEFIKNTSKEELSNLLFVAPDNGATGRRNVYLNSFNSPYITKDAGSFVKERDFNHMIDGKYPIISHEYSGKDNISGKTAILVDDMISSGGSMFDCIDVLNKKGIQNIYIMTTFSLFTRGIEKFDEYYRQGKLSGVYTTNLSYIPKEYQNNHWLHICDCSKLLSDVIYSIYNDESISGILNDRSYPVKLLEKKFNEKM